MATQQLYRRRSSPHPGRLRSPVAPLSTSSPPKPCPVLAERVWSRSHRHLTANSYSTTNGVGYVPPLPEPTGETSGGGLSD